MTTQLLYERNDLSEAQADIDSRIVRNVILIKPGMSKNRRYYSETVLRAAAGVFENSPAFADHPQKPGQSRSFRDITGQYTNVRFENGALRADRVFTRTQAGNDALGIAQDVIEGRISPTIAGLSINAVGAGSKKSFDDGEGFEVESISQALSIDDVSQPAAGGTYLSASMAGDDLLGSAIQTMDYQEWYDLSGKHIERHAKELKTIRQDDALKAAKTDAENARQALTEAQTALTAAQTEREAAVQEAATARRELAIERLLPTANVPKDWVEGLRARLMAVDEQQYAAIISEEQTKAKAAGFRIEVTGAGQVVGAPVIQEHAKPTAPDWDAIMRSPESFAKYQATFRS